MRLYWREWKDTGVWHCFEKAGHSLCRSLCPDGLMRGWSAGQAVERPEPAKRCMSCYAAELDRQEARSSKDRRAEAFDRQLLGRWEPPPGAEARAQPQAWDVAERLLADLWHAAVTGQCRCDQPKPCRSPGDSCSSFCGRCGGRLVSQAEKLDQAEALALTCRTFAAKRAAAKKGQP